MRVLPGARRLTTVLTALTLALAVSACAERVARKPIIEPARVPPPVAPAPPVEPEQVATAPLSTPDPRSTLKPPQGSPEPQKRPDAAQTAEAPDVPPTFGPETPPAETGDTPDAPADVAAAETAEQTPLGATSAGSEPLAGPLRRYRGQPVEIATPDYAATVTGRTLDALGEGDVADAPDTEETGIRTAEIGNPGLPDYYGTLPRLDEPVPDAPLDPFDPLAAPSAQAPEGALPPGLTEAEFEMPAGPDPAPEGYEQIDLGTGYPPQPAAITQGTDPQQDLQQQGYGAGGYAAAPVPGVVGASLNGPVTIALLTPNSDPRPSVQALAKDLSAAASLAAKDIGDRQLVLRGYDTAGTPERAALAAEQAIADGARLIIGPLFSGSASAVAQVAGQYGVNVIAFTTDRGVLRRGLYTLGYLPETEIDRIVSFAGRRGIGSIAALAPDTPYGGLIYSGVNEAGARHGVRIARIQAFQPKFEAMDDTAREFADFYRGSRDLGGLIMAASGKSLQALSAYLAYRDVLPSKVKFMGLGLWDDPETFREATLRGGWFPGTDPAKKAEFEARFAEAAGAKPAPIATLGYDGVVVAAALLADARQGAAAPFSPAALERGQGFDGMSGLFRFLPDGRNERQLAILEVGRREFRVVDPAPASFGEQVSGLSGFGQ